MTNPFLIGQLCYLRPVERSDAPLVEAWINDPEVRRTLTPYRPLNLAAEEAYIEQMTRDEHNLMLLIVHKEMDRSIGSCGLHNIDFRNRHAMFGIMIGEKDFWGQGIGAETTRLIAQYGFETLNLNRLWLYAYEFNERGIRAYTKVGYRQEGVLRQEIFWEGRYWDTIVMGLLRDEWNAAKAR